MLPYQKRMLEYLFFIFSYYRHGILDKIVINKNSYFSVTYSSSTYLYLGFFFLQVCTSNTFNLINWSTRLISKLNKINKTFIKNSIFMYYKQS